MKKFTFFGIAFILLSLFEMGDHALQSAESQNGSDQPRMVIPERVFNFGLVRAGEAVEHEFIIKNEGKAILKILNVSPT